MRGLSPGNGRRALAQARGDYKIDGAEFPAADRGMVLGNIWMRLSESVRASLGRPIDWQAYFLAPVQKPPKDEP